VRLLTHVRDVAPESLTIDLPVVVDFEAVTGAVTLPVFRPAND